MKLEIGTIVLHSYPFRAEILCILQSLSPMDSALVSKALSTSVKGRASCTKLIIMYNQDKSQAPLNCGFALTILSCLFASIRRGTPVRSGWRITLSVEVKAIDQPSISTVVNNYYHTESLGWYCQIFWVRWVHNVDYSMTLCIILWKEDISKSHNTDYKDVNSLINHTHRYVICTS